MIARPLVRSLHIRLHIRLTLYGALVLAGASARPGWAQEGLVLGGGAARGLAHAGVVVGLERLGYDPELVVGTSMGAIIGALYAAGYEPDAIWRQIQSVDWQQIFVPRALIVGPGREVRHPVFTYAIESRGVGSAGGVVPDWRINRLLTRLLFDAATRARGDFDRLPRRFRAVAADLDTGDQVVLGQGDLAGAVRASMAVPGFFSPVAWRGRVLVDGAIANNVPVSVARALGAERVLAVNVIQPGPLGEADKPLDVGLRGLRLLIGNAGPDSAGPDVLLTPDLEGVIEFGFPADPTPLLRAGLEATMTLADSTTQAWRGAADRGAARSLPPPPDSIGALVIESVEPELTALARRAFAEFVPGPYAPGPLLEAVDRLYATGLFDGVWPAVGEVPLAEVARSEPTADVPPDTLGRTRTGPPALRVRLVAAPRVAAGGAIGYDNDRGGRAWGALTLRTVLAAPAELTIAGSVNDLNAWGSTSLRHHSLYSPSFAWSAGGYYREADLRRFAGDEVVGEDEVRRAGGWLGLEVARVATERVGIAVVRAEHIHVEGGESGLSIGPLIRLVAAEPVPEPVGVPALVEAELRLGPVRYGRARVRGSLQRGLGALHVAAVGDLAMASADTPPDALPALGDRHAMPGLRWGEERGRVRVLGGADIAYPIPLGGWARLRVRAGLAADDVDRLDGSEAWLSGGELGALWTTPFGTILAAVGANTRGDWRFDLSAGPAF